MPKAKATDQQFIDLWRQLQSPSAVAQELGMSERATHLRRVAIEGRYKIQLVADTKKSDKKHGHETTRLIISERRDVNRFEITDGIMLVGSDAHYSPGHLSVAHKALCNVLADLGDKVQAVVLNGDIFDGGSASRHPRIRWSKAPTIQQELEAVQERLGEIEANRPPGCKLLRTYGNHCARYETRLANQVPEYEGVPGFVLRDHLPHWEDSLRIDVNDDMVIIHDWHSGLHSGWNDVIKGGCHVVTGHTHELSAKAHRGFKRTHYGVKTGMLADEFQSEFDYRQGKPGFNWQSGFAVLTWVDGILLHPEFCAVRDDGRAYFRGDLYATP